MNEQTSESALVTDLMLETFRLNGRLLAAGDRLVAEIGLTSARWQVLGAVALAQEPQPVAHIARRMGLTRQAVQRVVNDLHEAGLIRFEPNPHHRRAKLVALTERGTAAYDAAIGRHIPWSEGLARDLDGPAIAAAIQLMRTLVERLDAGGSDDRSEEDETP
jgi:DNA-binding MarR family transcriptional regulator